MAQTILSKTKSDTGSPYCYYTVAVSSTANRTLNSVKVNFTITSALASSTSYIGSGNTIYGNLYLNGAWRQFTLKASSALWEGTTSHKTSYSYTITGLTPAQTAITGVEFKVTRNSGGSSCKLDERSCKNITIPSMPYIKVNGNNIYSVKFNGVEVAGINFNGVRVL